MVAGFTFSPPRYGVQPNSGPQRPVWGPPDVAALAMQGIGGLGDAFGKGFSAVNSQLSRENVNKEMQDIANNPQAQAMALLGMGQQYGAAGAGGYNRQGQTPTFATASGALGQPGENSAAAMLRRFEGYKDTPYWDTNAFRVGYGSDTVTNPQTGEVSPVRRGMQIERSWADADLARRIPEFQEGIAKKVPIFADLPEGVKAGLTSVAYNYGSLPDRIIPAVMTGDPRQIAVAVASLRGDNDGVNAKRRLEEARAIAASGGSASGPVPAQVPGPTQTAQATQAARTPVAQPQLTMEQAMAPGNNVRPQQQTWEEQRQASPAAPVVQQAQTLAPKPEDQQVAAAVVQNQVATKQQQQATATQQRQGSFMGVPSMQPGANINPGAPQMQGGGGQDTLIGGSGGAPAQAPAPAPPQGQPAAAPGVPGLVAPQPIQYRPPNAALPTARLDPRLVRALGWAVQSGDNGAVAAATNLLAAQGKENTGFELKEIGGQGVLFNTRTGEIAPIGGGTAKAPQTIEQGGIQYAWNGQQYVPAIGGSVPGTQFRMLSPEDLGTRRQLGIPDTDKRVWQQDLKTGKWDAVSEPRANEDKTFTQEHALYQDFENSQPVKDYRGMEQGVQGLAANFAEGNATADTVAVIQLFKTIDPTSTVSQSEVATQSNAAGVPEQLRSLWNRAVGEGGKFSPELRARIFNTAQRLLQNRQGQVRQMADSTVKRAKSYGLNPENVVVWQPHKFERATPDMFPDREVDGSTSGAVPAAPRVQIVPDAPGAPAVPGNGATNAWPPGLPQPGAPVLTTKSGLKLFRE